MSKLSKLREAATQGEWKYGRFYYPQKGPVGDCEITPVGEFAILAKVYLPVEGSAAQGEGEANAELIIYLHNKAKAIDELVDAAENLKDVLTTSTGYLWDATDKIEKALKAYRGDE